MRTFDARRRAWVYLVATIALCGCGRGEDRDLGSVLEWGEPLPATEAARVSLIKLVATPERFDRRFVQVHGYVVLQEGETAIYLTEEFADKTLRREAIALHIPVDDEAARTSLQELFDGRYATVQGKFEAVDDAEVFMYAGSLEAICITATRKQ